MEKEFAQAIDFHEEKNIESSECPCVWAISETLMNLLEQPESGDRSDLSVATFSTMDKESSVPVGGKSCDTVSVLTLTDHEASVVKGIGYPRVGDPGEVGQGPYSGVEKDCRGGKLGMGQWEGHHRGKERSYTNPATTGSLLRKRGATQGSYPHMRSATQNIKTHSSCPAREWGDDDDMSVQQPSDIENIRILIDSGASSHMVPFEKILLNKRGYSGNIRMADNETSIGIEAIGETTNLSDIYLVPNLSFGLISIGKLDDEDRVCYFRKGRFYCYDSDGNIIFTGTKRNGLYFLDDEYILQMLIDSLDPALQRKHKMKCERFQAWSETGNLSIEEYLEITKQIDREAIERALELRDDDRFELALPVRESGIEGSASRRPIYVQHGFNPLEILHNRWGHASESAIKRTLREAKVRGSGVTYDQIKDLTLRFCMDCLRGRMRAFARAPTGSDEDFEVLECIGADYKPFGARSMYGHKGFLILSDRRSHWVAIYPVRSKLEIVDCMDTFNREVVQRSSHQWKTLQADSENVFIRGRVERWLKRRQIAIQKSAPRKHSQNGMVERDVQTILDKMRIIMAAGDVPLKYWNFAIKYAADTYNRTHIPIKTLTTPYEMVWNERPDVSDLVPFYAVGIFHLTPEERHRKAWAFKGEPCRMLGYEPGSKNSYKVLVVRNGKVLVRHDVIFDESYATALRQARLHPESQEVWDYIDRYMNDEEESVDESKGSTPAAGSDDDEGGSDLDEHEIGGVEPNEESDGERSVDSVPRMLLRERRPQVRDKMTEHIYNVLAGDKGSLTTDSKFDLEHWFSTTVECCCTIDHQHIPQLPQNPKSLQEALNGPDRVKWIDAITAELRNLEDYGCFGAAPQNGRGMKMKLILIYKYDNDFSIRAKARLVVCGYSQIKGIEYMDTYAPTTLTLVVNIVIHLIGHLKLFTGDFDVGGAFLECLNDFVNYGWLPPELNGGIRMRVRLLKSVYGEKQAGKLWWEKLAKVLTDIGFQQCPEAPTLYLYKQCEDMIVVVTHVDDGLIGTNSELRFEWLRHEMMKHLKKIKLLRPVERFLGSKYEIKPAAQSIEVDQSQYIQKLNCLGKEAHIPMGATINLKRERSNPNNPSLLVETGKLRFVADHGRWDILAALGEVSSGGEKQPSDRHVTVCNQIKDYLRCTEKMALKLGSAEEIRLFGMCDAQYNTYKRCKSRIGGALFLSKSAGAFYAYSKTSYIVCQSSTHGEIIAVYVIARYVIYVRIILAFLGYEQHKPTTIYVDNKSAIEIVKTMKQSEKTGSINMQINSIRQQMNMRKIQLKFIASTENVADILTKPLPREIFEKHRRRILSGFNSEDFETVLGSVAIAINELDSLERYVMDIDDTA